MPVRFARGLPGPAGKPRSCRSVRGVRRVRHRSRGNHTTITDLCPGFDGDRTFQSSRTAGRARRSARFATKALDRRPESRRSSGKVRRVSRRLDRSSGIDERNAGADAIHIGDAFEMPANGPCKFAVFRQEALHCSMTGGGQGRVTPGMMQTETEQATAHPGHAVVNQRKKGRASWPRNVSVSSRLRRVAASRPR